MSDLLEVHISNCGLAKRVGAVYAILSYEPRCVYVGQTLSRLGAMGRLAQHVSNSYANTFQQRLCQHFRYEEVQLKRIVFAAAPLTERPEFLSDAVDYREAVEFLVQRHIIEAITETKFRAGVVSFVRRNAYVDISFVQDEAKHRAAELWQWLQRNE